MQPGSELFDEGDGSRSGYVLVAKRPKSYIEPVCVSSGYFDREAGPIRSPTLSWVSERSTG